MQNLTARRHFGRLKMNHQLFDNDNWWMVAKLRIIIEKEILIPTLLN